MTHQKPFRGIQLNRTHPLVKGLVGCWVFNEATGKTSFDLSGHNNHGALKNGVAWDSSKFGGGLEFDRVNDYVDCGNNASLNITDAITIEAWVKPNTVSDEMKIVSKDAKNANAYDFAIWKTGNLIFYAKYGAVWDYTIFSLPIIVGVWQHVVVTYNGSITKSYVDGIEDSTTEAHSGLIGTTAKDLYIGAKSDDLINLFNGAIDSVRIYNRALSADEITRLYKEPYTMFRRPVG